MTDFWRNRRVLVTGGTGFLGYHLIKQLLQAGATVRSFALAGKSNALENLSVEQHFGDIRDATAVRKAAVGCDLVFHTAGPVAVWGPALKVMDEAHRQGTANVIAAVSKDVRVVHTSSIVCTGGSRTGQVLDEDTPFNFRDKIDYVFAKHAAELVALDAANAGHNVVVVNPGYLVGPEDFEPSVMGKLCARVWKGRMAIASPGGFNLVDVRDVAAGHMLAAEHGQIGRRYILGGENHTMALFIRLLASAAGLRPRATPTLPTAAMWTAAAIAELRSLQTNREPYPSFQHVRLNRYSWYVSSQRAIRELGYSPRPLMETARDAFASFAAEGERPMRGLTRWWMRPAA